LSSDDLQIRIFFVYFVKIRLAFSYLMLIGSFMEKYAVQDILIQWIVSCRFTSPPFGLHNIYPNSYKTFDVCVTVYHQYNNINNQLDATITIYKQIVNVASSWLFILSCKTSLKKAFLIPRYGMTALSNKQH